MSVFAATQLDARRTNALFELESLEALPCGCVSAAYRARPWDVAVVSIEAKGAYCLLPGHTQGQVLRLGDLADLESEPYDLDEDEDEDQISMP